MKVFRSTQPIQRGYGIGGLFRGLLRAAAPMLKRVGKRALQVGVNTLGDMATNNKTFSSALGTQMKKEALKTLNNRRDLGKSINTPGIADVGPLPASSRKRKGTRKVARKKRIKKNLQTVDIPGLRTL